MLDKIFKSINKDIYVNPPGAIAMDSMPIYCLHHMFKINTVRNKHLPWVCPQVSFAQNQQRPTDCARGNEVTPKGDQVGAEKLFIEEQIYIYSSRKHSEKLL